MSQLTTNVKIIYCAVYYNGANQYEGESLDYDLEEEAINAAQQYISTEVETCGKFLYARIEKRVVPIYN